MTVDVEYAIKADVRNNPVIREIDVRQRGDLRRTVLLVVLTVGTFLLVAWQYASMQTLLMDIERLKSELAQEQVYHRQLRLNLERLRAPHDIERRARAIGMRPATLEETIVIEGGSEIPSQGILALVR